MKMADMFRRIGGRLKPIAERAGQAARRIVSQGKQILKRLGSHMWQKITAWYVARRQQKTQRMSVGAKVVSAIALFTVIGGVILTLISGGLKDGSEAGQAFLWLLITLAGAGVIGGIVYAATKKKLRAKYLLWVAAGAAVLLAGVGVWRSRHFVTSLFETTIFTFADMMRIAVPFAIVIAAVIALTYLFGGNWATKTRKVAWSVVIIFVGAASLLLYTEQVSKTGDGHKPAASAPASAVASTPKATMLTMGPEGKSDRIPVPFQMRVVLHGKDYRHHCVYADGHEESFVLGERPCASGDMPFVYATNLRANGANIVTYTYEK